jgi:hypothetical protein
VLIEVRVAANVGDMRTEPEWPLRDAILRRLYLDAADARLHDTAPQAASEVSYDPNAAQGRAVFDYRFLETTELTGHMKLRLWVQALDADDMDLFVGIEKQDAQGRTVPFVFYAMNENGPAALGWLRVSHRTLDPVRSRPEQPFHSHLEERRLAPGECVAVDIEIWPTSILFRAGESLRLVVQGRDIPADGVPNAPIARHEPTRNRGRHVLHTGGSRESYLLVPVIRRAAEAFFASNVRPGG